MGDDAGLTAGDLIARTAEAVMDLEWLAADVRRTDGDPGDAAAPIRRALRTSEAILADLEALLQGGRGGGAGVGGCWTLADGPRQRVLVVDDDPCVRAALALTFEDEGYETRAAQDGRAALELLAAWSPDVIVLDLFMPIMDGPSFRAAQLGLDGLAEIPVIVLSAARRSDGLAEPLHPSAVLPKPCDPDALLGAVRHATAGLPG